jgi:hypothetical protein
MAKENSVSIKITPDDLTKITDSLIIVEETLAKYLISLTPDERKEIPKMSDKTTPFVEKTLDYAEKETKFAPAYLDVPGLRTDIEAVNGLTKIHRTIEMLNQNLSDTIMLSGSEAYIAALSYYNSVKQAAKMNVPGAETIYDDLKKRFKK